MFKKVITLALAIVCLASIALVGVSAMAPEKEGEVVYTATLTTPKMIEDVQGFVTYDPAVLKVVACETNQLGGSAIVNTDVEGTVYFNASVVNGLDFTTAATLVEIKFEVIGEGDIDAAITIEEMTEKDGDSYFTEGHQVNDAVVLVDAFAEYVAPTTTAAPTTAATTAADDNDTTVAPTATNATSVTEKPADDVDAPDTGATVAIVAVMSVVALAGVAVVALRKKVNA